MASRSQKKRRKRRRSSSGSTSPPVSALTATDSQADEQARADASSPDSVPAASKTKFRLKLAPTREASPKQAVSAQRGWSTGTGPIIWEGERFDPIVTSPHNPRLPAAIRLDYFSGGEKVAAVGLTVFSLLGLVANVQVALALLGGVCAAGIVGAPKGYPRLRYHAAFSTGLCLAAFWLMDSAYDTTPSTLSDALFSLLLSSVFILALFVSSDTLRRVASGYAQSLRLQIGLYAMGTACLLLSVLVAFASSLFLLVRVMV